MRLTLTTSDASHEVGTATTTASSAGGVVTILSGPAHPSYLHLQTFAATWVKLGTCWWASG